MQITRRKKARSRASTPGSRATVLALTFAVLAAAAIRLAPFLLPQARLWGVDMLIYFETPLIIAFSVLPASLALPQVRMALGRLCAGRINISGVFLFWSIVAGVGALILIHPMGTFFYGDGGSIIPEIFKLGKDPGYTSDILENYRSSPLAGILLRYIALWTPELLHWIKLPLPTSSMFPFPILGLFSFLGFVMALTLERGNLERLLLLIMLLGLGGTILFFGYVEFYAPVYAALVFYLLAAERALKDDGPLWLPAVAFTVACAAHFYSIALLPSLAYVAAVRSEKLRSLIAPKRNFLLLCAGAVAVISVLYISASLLLPYNRILIPLYAVKAGAGVQAYTVFSLIHVLDILNIVLLLAPLPALYLAAVAAVRKWRPEGIGPVHRFHFLTSLFFLGFLIFANSVFGLARDWDLASPLGLFLCFFAYRIMRINNTMKSGVPAVAALASLILVIPWMTVMLDDRHSVKRFEHIVELDAGRLFADYALSGFEALRKHYVHSNEIEDEIRIEKRMVERLGYPEHYRLLLRSSLVIAPSLPERATEKMNWMLERLRVQVTGLLDEQVDRDYAISIAQADSIAAAVAYQAYFFGIHTGLNGKLDQLERLGLKTPGMVIKGMDAFAAERYQDALALTKSAFDHGFVTGKLAALHANSLLMLGRKAEAEASFETALKRFPDDPELRYLAAYGYLVKGINTARAQRLLEEASEMDATDELRGQINALLEKLRAAGFTSAP